MPEFDPYLEWLDIDPVERPADHYRLLGLARFETDRERIARAADERMAHLRQFQSGPRGRYTQQLLNELSAARVCLLDPVRKMAYDTELATRISALEAARRASAVGWDQRAQASAGPPPETASPPPLAPVASDSSWSSSPTPAFRPTNWHLPLLLFSCLVAAALALAGWTLGRRPPPASPASETKKQHPASSVPPPTDAPHIRQGASGEITFPAQAWSAGGDAAWPFQLYKPGIFFAEVTYATADSFVEGSLELRIDDRPRRLSLRPTGGLASAETDSITLAVPKSGRHTLTVRLLGTAPETTALRKIQFIPVNRDAPP